MKLRARESNKEKTRRRKIVPGTVHGQVTVKRQDDRYWVLVDTDNYILDSWLIRSVFCVDYPPICVSAHPDNVRVIRDVVEQYDLDIRTPKRWQRILKRTKAEERLAKKLDALAPAETPPGLFCGKLMHFQKIGLDFLEKTDGVSMLADEMGLGKTVQTLAYLSKHPEALPAVVVAPLITVENWRRETERFLRLPGQKPRMPVIKKIRSGKPGPLPKADIYLINYELVYKRYADLAAVTPKTVVYDEIQNLRNPSSKKYGGCWSLARINDVEHRIGLSGTPIYNRGIEMYGIADIIKPGVLGERYEFVGKYCDYNNQTSNRKRKPLAEALRRSVLLRRRKLEVMTDLPEKNRVQQEVDIDVKQYDKEVEAMYQRMESAKTLADSAAPDEKDEMLQEFNKEVREMRIQERQVAGLAKAPHVVEYLSELLRDYEEEKFVVFCHHREVHKILYRGLARANPVQVIGGQSDRARQAAIDAFQNDPGCRVIICGLRAGNLGINLTSAAYVVFAELDWSPAVHMQAEDRLHRIGQKRSVFSHYLVGRGTFDEFLVGMLTDKAKEISGALGDRVERMDNKKALEALRTKFGRRAASGAGLAEPEGDRMSM